VNYKHNGGVPLIDFLSIFITLEVLFINSAFRTLDFLKMCDYHFIQTSLIGKLRIT
jgi:hypothetical protein